MRSRLLRKNVTDVTFTQNNSPEDVKREAVVMLSEIRPTTLHFLADPYDDTTSTIYLLLSSILGTVSVFAVHPNTMFIEVSLSSKRSRDRLRKKLQTKLELSFRRLFPPCCRN